MKTILVILIIVLMAMVVVSLVRGVIAFIQSTKDDLNTPGTGATPMQLQQNRMMFARIKYQALAVLVVSVLLLLTR